MEDLGLTVMDGVTCQKVAFIHDPKIYFHRYFDVATGRHVANLGVPDDPGGRRVIPFAPDGRLFVSDQPAKANLADVTRRPVLPPAVSTIAGATTIDYRPVHMYTLSNDVEVVPPKARVY